MTDLPAITALGGTMPADRRFGALRITENPDLALASLALRRGAAPPAPMGLELPEPGRSISRPDIAAFWTGPDQWMIEAPGRADEDLAAALAPHAQGCSLTDQTDAWVCFEIASEEGAKPIVALMEKLVNLDAPRFGAGNATRTVMHHMSVFAVRRAEDRLAIIGMRSLAGALWHALVQALHRTAKS